MEEGRKQLKPAVDYSPSSGRDKCGGCEHFRPSLRLSLMGVCTQVYGEIDPKFWCKLFKLELRRTPA